MSRYPSNAASSSVSRECSFIPSTWEQQAARTAFWTQQIRVRIILSVWWSSRSRRGIMPIKDILVHVDESLACDNRLRVAADLAVRFDARLNGVGLAEPVADKRFHVHLRRSGLAGEWHTGIGLPESFVPRRARVADLVVLGQPDPGGPA